jgi:hypothetical protein
MSVLGMVLSFAPLAFVLVLSFGINRISTLTAQMLFFSTAAAFAGLSLFGYTTKKSLSGFGTFLLMGLFGIIGATVLNIFIFKSPGLDLAISIIGVLIFAGLTAYDTQKIKNSYYAVQGTDFAGKAVVMGALTLYLDFINMFLFLLRLFGDRR